MMIEHIHKPISRVARLDGIVSRGVLLGIGDINVGAHTLNVERSEVTRNALVIEGIFVELHLFEGRVKDVDPSAAEISGQDESLSINLGNSRALVDSAVLR